MAHVLLSSGHDISKLAPPRFNVKKFLTPATLARQVCINIPLPLGKSIPSLELIAVSKEKPIEVSDSPLHHNRIFPFHLDYVQDLFIQKQTSGEDFGPKDYCKEEGEQVGKCPSLPQIQCNTRFPQSTCLII